MNTYEQFLVEKAWKKCNWCQKRSNQREELFLVNNRECFALSHFTCLCFFNCQSWKYGQLSHNYIKRHLGNPSFSSTSIVVPLFSWITSFVYIFKLRLQYYGGTPQEPTSSHIHTSYSYLQNVVIERFLNLVFDSTGETL